MNLSGSAHRISGMVLIVQISENRNQYLLAADVRGISAGLLMQIARNSLSEDRDDSTGTKIS